MNPQIVAWFLGSVIVGIEKLRNQDTTLYRITVIVHAVLYPPFIVQLLIVIDFFFGRKTCPSSSRLARYLGWRDPSCFALKTFKRVPPAQSANPERKWLWLLWMFCLLVFTNSTLATLKTCNTVLSRSANWPLWFWAVQLYCMMQAVTEDTAD